MELIFSASLLKTSQTGLLLLGILPRLTTKEQSKMVLSTIKVFFLPTQAKWLVLRALILEIGPMMIRQVKGP